MTDKSTTPRIYRLALTAALAVLGVMLWQAVPVYTAPAPDPGSASNVVMQTAEQTEVWVDDDYDSHTEGWGETHFAAIQDGVDAVTDTGTVHVEPGTYVENVAITKPMKLLGAGSEHTTIDGQDQGPPILVNGTTSVTIAGFTITGLDEWDNAGVRLNGSDHVTVTSNHFSSGGGIDLASSHHNAIIDNQIEGRGSILIGKSWDNRIEGNELHVAYPGQIRVGGGSSNNAVISNTIIGDPENASCTGIRITNSSNNQYLGNTLRNFRVHVLVSYSDDSVIAGNDMAGYRDYDPRYQSGGIIMYHASNHQLLNNDITGVADVGISMFGSSVSNTLQANTITSVPTGIEVFYGSNHNELVNNDVLSNTVGIIVDEASHNTIHDNNFIDNGTPGIDEEGDNEWSRNGAGNYWSGYEGTDADHDGIGDTSHDIPPTGTDPHPLMSRVPITPVVPPSLDPLPSHPWNWTSPLVITDHQTWANETVVLTTTTIEIREGGALTLSNVALEHRPPGWARLAPVFRIQSNGALEIHHSSIVAQGGHIQALPGSRLHIENSHLTGLGSWDAGGALSLGGDGAVIKNNVIRDAYAGIVIRDGASNQQIVGNHLSYMRKGIGACCGESPGHLIERNEISHIIGGGIDTYSLADTTITGNEFRENWGGSVRLIHTAGAMWIYGNSMIDSGQPFNHVQCGDELLWYQEHSGNYWSDYEARYPDAEEHATWPGIWDAPYEIEREPCGDCTDCVETKDMYPLMHSVPAVWGGHVVSVSPVTATLEAHILRKEYDTVSARFEYRKAGSAVWHSTPPAAYDSSGVYSATVTGLHPATDYEFRPKLSYSRGEVTGTVHTFRTGDTIADFTAAPVQGVRPLSVTFSATTPPPATYLWDFGDHATSTLRSPIHTYPEVGLYTVTLTVSTPQEIATLSRSGYIRAWEDQVFLPVVVRSH